MRCKFMAPIFLPDNFNLFLWGDTQWGNVGVHEKGVDKLFDMVESEYRGVPEKNNFAAHMGDHVEAITIGDSRFTLGQILPKQLMLRSMIDHAIAREKTIAHKTLFILKGNHEQKWINTYGDIGAEIARALNPTNDPNLCQYGSASCVVHFHRKRNKSLICRGYHHHGAKKLTSAAKDALQREANKAAALKQRLMLQFDGAIYMAMGHTHGLRVVPPDPTVKIICDKRREITQAYLLRDKGLIVDQSADYIPPEFRTYINTGSFLKKYSDEFEELGTSYAEWEMMPPVELGFVVLTFRNARFEKAYTEVV